MTPTDRLGLTKPIPTVAEITENCLTIAELINSGKFNYSPFELMYAGYSHRLLSPVEFIDYVIIYAAFKARMSEEHIIEHRVQYLPSFINQAIETSLARIGKYDIENPRKRR